jgi:excisionase family DNA binding protein
VTGRLLTARQVAEKLGFEPATIVRWTRERKLPGYRCGRALRYIEAEIDEWLESNATAGGATRGVSPTPDATRQNDGIVRGSPTPLRPVAATTEEDDPDAP